MTNFLITVFERDHHATWLLDDYDDSVKELKHWWWNPFKVKKILEDMECTARIRHTVYEPTEQYKQELEKAIEEDLRESE